MRNSAHAIAVLFAAAGILAVVGGCAGNAWLQQPLPAAPAAYSAGQHVSQRPAQSPAPMQYTRGPQQHVAERPEQFLQGSPGVVTRGQNLEYRTDTENRRSASRDNYLHGPMPVSGEANRDSHFVAARSSGFGEMPPAVAQASYPATGSAYPASGTWPAAPAVQPVQYESREPAGPVYGRPTPAPGATTTAPANGPIVPGPSVPSPVYGPGNNPPVGVAPYSGPLWTEDSYESDPQNLADMVATVQETHTGQFMFGVGINSDAGLTGQIVINERNFDITRIPTSFDDFVNGTAFRGGGQGFRIEALPGTQVQRYMVSLSEPYLLNTDISFNASAFYYDRIYFDWDEQRYGGRLGLGYRLTPDLSFSTSVRAENVVIRDPRLPLVWDARPELKRTLGNHDLFSARFSVTQDKRDRFFAPTQGHMLELSYEQVFGDFDYPRGEIDYRKYFLVRERPDGSGRHTLAFNLRCAVSGSDTPIFENYYAGGYSTLRGFNFRGASPKTPEGIIVGGRFRFLGSLEYMLPVTADDMLRMVAFCDFGTVERDIEMRSENFRVAPGFGLRIFVPAMGPAPIALDFAFPVAKSAFDDTQVFSFFVGFGR